MSTHNTIPRSKSLLRGAFVALCIGAVSFASAQLTTSPQTDLVELANTITGDGVQISNPVITCHSEGFGEFTYTGSVLGIQEGIILTSGRRTEAVGPNDVENKSFQQNTNGSAILNVVTGRTTRDACMFEFDIIPSGDSLKFNFALGSEEYNEWVGSQYNDVFGFFISGPGITGDPGIGNDHNIALIPNTNQPVTINNVNNGSNSQYYFDNAGGQHIQYDGLTRGLSARAQVQPCTSYHLKLIVADASDRKFDSGVFIERIQSNNISMALVTATGGPDLVEGCNNGFVRFTRGAIRPTPLTLEYYIQGTATNGVDYAAIGDPDPVVAKFVTIPANQASVEVAVNPVADGVAEPTESLLFILGNPYCVGAPLDTLVVSLADSLISNLSPAGPLNICPGGSVQFQASGGTTYAWSPASGLSATNIANPIASPSATTNYTVVISQGTCSRTISRLVRVSNTTLSSTITRPLCSGASNGALNLSVSGGTAPFAFAWTGPNGFTASNEDLVNVQAGTYNVTVTDGSGCTRTQSFNISEPAALSATVSPSILPFGENVACFGGTTGTLNLNLTGGTAPFGFAWTGPNGFTSTAQNLSALRAGAYSVMITDAGGCTTTAAYTMTQPTAIGAGVTGIQHVACFGSNIGSATATNTGGTPPFFYSWNTTPVQTTANATGLAPGTWTVTITDGYGCASTAVATINGPAQALGSTVGSTTHVTCFGAATGSTSISATGGTSPYSYSWNTTPVQTTATATALAAGTWTCTISDNNGCTTTRNVTINQPAAALTGNVSAQTNVLCFGNSTGSATVSASGGTAPYSYSWNTTPVRTTAAVSALSAGTWTCTITDAGGCAITVPVSITQPSAALALALDAQTNVLCFGNNTGSATVNTSGGTAPYSYAWNTSPVQTTATASGLIAGNYSCTVTDANGCTSLRSVQITQPTAALTSSVNAQTNVLCFGGNNGSATVAASGGTAPHTFVWNTTPVQNTATATGLLAGNWACTITDANGCTTVRNVSISQPAAALSAALSAQTNVLCFGNSTGTATMNASGGTAPYTFAWNTAPTQNAASATGLSAGTWTCTITDVNGCSVTRTATITQPATGLIATLDARIDVLCFGNSTGSATVGVSGGTAPYTYSWNTAPVQTTATATNLAAGPRTCTITDASGCSTTLDVTIAQPAAALSATLSTQTNVLCFGNSTGSATIDVSGGSAPYSYAWNTAPVQNSATATNLPAGTWTCTVTDANGCTRTRNVVITQPSAALASSLSAQTNVLCFGNNTGNATVSVTGGTTPYTYNWNTTPVQSTATASSLQAGMWTCTITDGNGCTSTSQVTITQPPAALTSSLSGQVNVLCHGANTGSGTVVAAGGTAPYTYSWNTTPVQTTATATNMIAGTRVCTTTDANGCTSTTSVTITQPAAALLITGTVSPATCGGAADGAVDATVSGGSTPYTIAWSGPNGFTSSNTDISAVEAGVYQLNITDANGCTASSSFNVGQPGIFTISGTTSDFNGFEVSCPGASDGSIAQTISGGTSPYSHNWSGPDGFISSDEDISALAAGTYTYIVTDDNGCSSSATYTMAAPPELSAALSSPMVSGGWNIGCDGLMSGSIDAGINGGIAPVTVNWSGPNGFTSSDEDLSTLGAGTYTLTMIDANGCRMTDAITLTAPPALTATGSMIAGVDCFNANNGIAQTAVSGGTAPYSYAWNTTPVQTTSNATDLATGTWTCTVTDANGCSTSAATIITGPSEALAVSVTGSVDVLCFDAASGTAEALATGGTAPYNYNWNSAPAQSTSQAIGLQAGTYTVTATDNNGCTATDEVTINAPSAALEAFIDQVAPVSCFGAEDGSATVSISGGSGSYTVTWNTVPETNGTSVNGLAPGLYVVTIADNNGCSETKGQPVTILGSNVPFELAMEITSISCNGAEDGAVDLMLSGGQGPYTHTWSDSNGLSTGIEDLVDLSPDTYSLVAIDGFGCRIDTSVTFTEPIIINIAGSITTAACLGSATGAVDASVMGGTAPYSFDWSGPDGFTSSGEDIMDLTAGIYTLLVTDDNGCTSHEAFNVNQPGSLDVVVTPFTFAGGHGVSCANASDGSILMEVSGGTAPYVITWSGPNGFNSSDEDLSNLASGTYNVTVTDDNGCAFQQQVVLTTAEELELGTLVSAFIGGYQVSCYGAGDGAVDLGITGGTAPFDILWSDGAGFNATTEDIEAIGPGIYQVLVTDANGCTQNASVQLDGPAVLDLSAQLSQINGNNVSCAGATDGSIDLSVVGGVAPYAYTWNNGSTDEDLANITSGTFDVTVSDQNGCEATSSYTLTAPLSVQAVLLSNTFPNGMQISCGDATDGSIDATISGGTLPYTIAWTGPGGFIASTADILDLTIGDYTLNVSDANGCQSVNTASITGPEPLAVELSTVTYSGGYNIPCSEVPIGVLSALVSGGMPDFTYAWSGPNGSTSTDAGLTTLDAGTYDLVVTDQFGCTTSGSATLTAPEPLEVVIEFTDFDGSQVSCAGNDGGITLSVSGGTPAYAFDWNGANGFASQLEDLSDLVAGDYTLIVHDANGCSTDTTVTLMAPVPLSATFVTAANACATGTAGNITTMITGGGEPYVVAWAGPDGFTSTAADLSDLGNGTYVLTVNDALGCSLVTDVTLDGPAPISMGTYVSFYGQYNIQCEGDSTGVVELDPQGGVAPFTITMSGPDGFASNAMSNTGLVAGAYDVSLTDNNGCVVDTTIVLTEPDNGVAAELTLSIYPSGTNVSCYGASDGSIDATVTGGTGPYVFSWRGPDSLEFVTEDVSGLPAGDYAYELVVTDANQCSFFTTVTLIQPDTALYMSSTLSTYEGGSNTTCNDATNGAIDLSVAGGNGSYTFDWSGPAGFSSTEQNIADLTGGTYTIAITDLNGCVLENSIGIVAPEVLAPTLEAFTYPGGTAISCNGMMDGAIAGVIQGGTAPYALSWSGPNGFTSTEANISGLAAGTYCLTSVDANGCTAEICTDLDAPLTLEATTVASAAGCGSGDGAVDLHVSGGIAPFGFAWNNGTNTEDLSDLQPDTYHVLVTDANGCTTTSTAVVDGTPGIAASGVTDNTTCFGTSEGGVDLSVTTGTAPFTFAWSNGSTAEDLTGVPAGSYSVSVTDDAGCAYQATFVVLENPEISIDTIVSVYSGGYNVSAFGAQDGSITTAVSGGTEPFSFEWSNGATTESISGLAAGEYSLLVTDANGCTATLEVTLTENKDIEMPTGFSPNNDGSNDTFVVRGIDGYPKNLFTVVNRWGNVVYEQPNYKNQWSGDNSQGAQLPDGTYFIILSLNDGMRTLQGYVDLRR